MFTEHMDGLVQHCSTPSVLVMEILQSCAKPSILAQIKAHNNPPKSVLNFKYHKSCLLMNPFQLMNLEILHRTQSISVFCAKVLRGILTKQLKAK